MDLTPEVKAIREEFGEFKYDKPPPYDGVEVSKQPCMIFSDKSIYDGEQDAAGNKHGKGVQQDVDGNFFEGFWKKDMRHGCGRQIKSNKEVYIGDWDMNQRKGLGFARFPNGNTYDGEWADNKRSGEGEAKY